MTALENSAHQGGDLESHGRVDVSHDMTRFDAIRLRQLVESHLPARARRWPGGCSMTGKTGCQSSRR